MATEASDRDLTENGVTFRAKVMELNTVTTVKAYRDRKQEQFTSRARELQPAVMLTGEEREL